MSDLNAEVKCNEGKEVKAMQDWEEILAVPSFECQQRYYVEACGKVDNVPCDIIYLIALFANAGFRIGQMVDVQDNISKWCVAEVLEIAKNSIKVHYVGWTMKWDTWIELGGKLEVAPVFSHTVYSPDGMKTFSYNQEYKRNVLKQMVEFGFEEEKATKVFEQYGRKQDAWNALLAEKFALKWK
eukprot:TRINITY_DN3879_c0_g1_i2.p3 TRINITY_DN3879_c0_g1~~TRINITY_DN3879_c0_g1_i2.p3  ORF type:complete len:184 (+),score=56.60 TRINITY_DN3879_c0_g1_i2:21-572(+)